MVRDVVNQVVSLVVSEGVELRLDERLLLVRGVPAALGARAFDLLRVLVEERHRVVSKDELMARVWPRSVVEENNLAVQISALRKALGQGAITTIAGLGYKFTAPLSPAAAAAGTAHPATAAVAEPRAERGTLLGRAAELSALQAALLQHSLVTVVGMAGVGKTSLARAVWRGLAAPGDPANGKVAERGVGDLAGWVDLAPLTDGALLSGQAATALGLSPTLAVSAASLAGAIGQRQAVLVLDNCEHLVADVAAWVGTLLAAAPGLRVLATSQVPVHVAQEHVWRLQPFEMPAALALFEARAQAHDASFAIDEHNRAAALDICSQLDGVALAIELAAARVRLLGVDGLRSRLGERLRLLVGDPRSTEPRHKTLRTALDWSCELLPDDERALFCRLSVFVGGASLPALQQVASDARLDAWAVLELLGQLVDKSLVVVDHQGSAARAAGAPDDQAGEPRYHLLETMRQYAAERLQASGEQAGSERALWQRRHAQHFAEFGRTHGTATTALTSRADRWPLVLEHDNLRAALDWMAVHKPCEALALAAAMAPFWRERGHHAEARRRIDSLLNDPANQQASEAGTRARVVLCALANEQQQLDRLQALACQVLVDARTLGLRSLESLGHIWLAHACEARSDWAGAQAQFHLALGIVRELGETGRVAETLCNIACIHIESGQPAESLPLLHEALRLFGAARNLWGLGFAESTLGEAAHAAGDFERALVHADAGLAHHRRLQHQHRLVYSLCRRATTLLRLGRLDEARADLVECLVLGSEHGFDEFITHALVQAALLAARQGKAERAAMLLGAAQGQADRGAGLGGGLGLAEFERVHVQVAAGLAPATWAQAFARGRSLQQKQAVALALADAQG